MTTLQELIDLTPAQMKAWKRIEKAVKDFRAAGGEFYCVLDSMSGYNGQHVKHIDNTGDYATTTVDMPTIDAKGFTSFADDWHGFTMMPGVEVEEE